MRLMIAAIGRLKAGPERELAERYSARIEKSGRAVGLGDLEIIEIKESRAGDVGKRVLEESTALLNVIPDRAAVIVLDQSGRSLDSGGLTAKLQNLRDRGCPAVVFIIGGADGLSAAIKERGDLKLAFGAATWPHQLVRIMLLEQLYRSVTILSGHPYHRI